MTKTGILFRVASGLLAAALTLSLTACGGSSSNSDASAAANSASDSSITHLRFAYHGNLCGAPIYMAIENGYFADENIELEQVTVDAAHVGEAIGADQVDVGMELLGKMLQPIENGLPIKFTAGIHTGCVKIVAPKDSGIESPADLKGKKIGVSGLAGAETIVAKRVLANEGISFDETNPEAEFVVFNKNDLGQALENGAIDVIAMSDPIVSQFVQQYDLNVLVDTATSEEFSSEYCCASLLRNKLVAIGTPCEFQSAASLVLAEEHPDIAAAFTRAVLKASVYVNEHPEEAAKIQLDKKYVTGDLEFNTSLLKSYNYIPSVQGGYDAIKLSVEQLSQIGILKEGTDAQQFTDNVYAFYDDVPDSYTAADIADIA